MNNQQNTIPFRWVTWTWWVLIMGGLALNGYVAFGPETQPLPAFFLSYLPRLLVQGIFGGAVVAHIAESMVAANKMRSNGLAVHMGWILQTVLLGGPSLIALKRTIKEYQKFKQ
eukprot:gb/GECH01013285.1/.p1 GENE.gb/GECH01013285.1/~~gb/GECH01013285.1/.p1  ORF type:complete len:114 (+),score=26.75 gb/GECH01013285.1/:1-342(+)